MKTETKKVTNTSSSKSCNIPGITDKPTVKKSIRKDGKIRKVIRKIKEKLLPVADVRVRYDGEVRKWAVLDSNNNPSRHLEQGTLRNVTFDSIKVLVPVVGCGSSNMASIGVANGSLTEGDINPEKLTGFKNLQYYNNAFADYHGNALKSASVVILLPGRKALYQD